MLGESLTVLERGWGAHTEGHESGSREVMLHKCVGSMSESVKPNSCRPPGAPFYDAADGLARHCTPIFTTDMIRRRVLCGKMMFPRRTHLPVRGFPGGGVRQCEDAIISAALSAAVPPTS